MDIYWMSGSPYAWRALLALEIKGVPYVSRLLDFSKGETKTPEFLALNPRGKVPALKDGEVVQTESLAIIAYLDRKFPEPALFGRTPEETGRIWRAISESVSYLEPAGRRIATRIFFGDETESADRIGTAVGEVHAELRAMEDALARRRWLAGDDLSAADIAVYPFIELLLRAAGKDAALPLDLRLLPLPKTYPAIAAWRERIVALPGYERTYPPHWRQAGAPAAASAAAAR
jgi:glutathione S-transferase